MFFVGLVFDMRFYRNIFGGGVDNATHKIQYDLRPSKKDLLRFGFLFLVDFVKCIYFSSLSLSPSLRLCFRWFYTAWFIRCVMLTLPDFYYIVTAWFGMFIVQNMCAAEAWLTLRWSNTLHFPTHKSNAIESHVPMCTYYIVNAKIRFYWQINGRRGGQTMLLKAIFNCNFSILCGNSRTD